MSVNYDRVCRLCLSSRSELLPIFPTTSSDDSDSVVLASKIKDCVAIQICENDDLSTNVCRKCLDNVNNWHIFKSVCERTQNKLQSLIKKDGSQLEELKIKSEPLSDEAYDDGVVIDGNYPENEDLANKLQPEGPPILASLGLTPRSDKGMESDKDEDEEDEEVVNESMKTRSTSKAAMPEVSITVMRPSGETLSPRQGLPALASKDCLVCGRSYRYSHNARRHELTAHSFDRYTNKIQPKKLYNHMQPKLRPNPFNPSARMMPHMIPKSYDQKRFVQKPKPKLKMQKMYLPPPRKTPIPIAPKPHQNSLPYPLRIKALKDLQIKKKEPQLLKTLLTSKPEVLVSEPEIMNSGPESPETLISEPELSAFHVETVLTEPDAFNQQDDEEQDEDAKNHSQNYDTVEMGSENEELEIARQREDAVDKERDAENETAEDDNEQGQENSDEREHREDNGSVEKDVSRGFLDLKDEDNEKDDINNDTEDNNYDDNVEQDQDMQNDDMEDDEDLPPIAPVVELNEEMQDGDINETNEDLDMGDQDYDESTEVNESILPDLQDGDDKEDDPDKLCVTKAQRDFILKYRNIIEQINTKTCLCCNREYPRRKAVIQHLQKNGHKVPKHTCYNCVVTFGHIGALLSHMRSNSCTDLWKIIYNENGISDDCVLEQEPKNKIAHKDIVNARSYACRLCPAKFQLKQFITKHVLDNHEDGQSMVPSNCVHCGTRFKDKNILKRHVRNCDCTVYIACDLCTETFGNLLEFNEHALAVHASTFDQSDSNQSKCVDGRPTDCPICGKKNSSYPNLVKHLRAYHDEDKPHYCKHCDAKFEQATDLNKHIYEEHNSQGISNTEPDMSLVKEEAEEYHYSCTECNAIFETVDAWTDHQVAEHNQIAHHCDQCEKKFLRPSELAEHKNTHLRVKFYPCNNCSNSYNTPQKLTEHIHQKHAGTDEFHCNICVRKFKSRQAFSNHMRIHSKIPTTNRKPDQKGFAPQIVGKSIKQFPMVQPGVVFKPNSNVPNAPYCCDICGKGFMHKKNIWKHKKVLHADLINERHDSEENTMHASTEDDENNVDENGTLTTPQFDSFNFSYFNNTQTLESLPYSCEICYKRFAQRSSLWKHKRAQHGLGSPESSLPGTSTNIGQSESSGRSSCTICKLTFSDKKSYYRHRKNVHKSAVQMCKICGKPLNSTLELYEHLKAAHARELLGYNANQVTPKQEAEQDYDEDDGDQDSMDPSADYQARYPCDTCGKQFVGLLALQNHQCVTQVSSQPQTFDCEICHKSYTSIAALKSHRGWHLRSPDGKAAANNTALWMPQLKVTNKISKHEVIDPSQLAKVSHSTSSPATAKRRLPPEVEVTVVNPNKKLRSDDSVEMEQSMSGAIEGKYCNICDKEFTKRAAYQRHMDEVHQPNSVFCPVCDKSFSRKSTLLIHMKKHYDGEGSNSGAGQLDDDGHACGVCGTQFDNENDLLNHHAAEHGDESEEEEEEDEEDGEAGEAADSPGRVPRAPGEFTCAQCGDGVATPRDLIAHRNMHATPTKFFCNICKVFFARALDLSSHTRARHSDNDKLPFPCAMCDRSYMNKKSLQRHIDMTH